MYHIEVTGQFKKDLKRIKKRSEKRIDLIREVIGLLQENGVRAIPSKMHPHKLSGN